MDDPSRGQLHVCLHTAAPESGGCWLRNMTQRQFSISSWQERWSGSSAALHNHPAHGGSPASLSFISLYLFLSLSPSPLSLRRPVPDRWDQMWQEPKPTPPPNLIATLVVKPGPAPPAEAGTLVRISDSPPALLQETHRRWRAFNSPQRFPLGAVM